MDCNFSPSHEMDVPTLNETGTPRQKRNWGERAQTRRVYNKKIGRQWETTDKTEGGGEGKERIDGESEIMHG